MNDFKIGDKVKLKKLSEEEFEEIYNKKRYLGWNYDNYLNFYNRFSNQILEIIEMMYGSVIYCKDCDVYFYIEELEKINYLKTKYKIVNKLLNKGG